MKKMQRRGKVDVDAKKASGAAQLGNLPEGTFPLINRRNRWFTRLCFRR